MTLLTFFGFTALVGAIAYWKTRKDRMATADDYFLGGRSLSGWVIAGSLMLTNLSTEQLIGLNGDAFRHTAAVMAWETTAALAMVATALFFLPYYLRNGLTTIPQFLANRYDETTRVIASGMFLFSYVLAFLPVVLVFGASGLESLFDVSENFGITQRQAVVLIVWSVGSVGSLYAIFGGLKAVAISDTVNGIGFLLVGLLIPYLGLKLVGDGSAIDGFSTLYSQEYPKFDVTGDEPGSFFPVGVMFTGLIVNQIFYWCINQAIIQRALGARSLKEGQKGVLIAAFLKLLGPVVLVLPGIIAYHLFKDTLSPEQSLLAYPELVKAVLPAALVGFFAAVMVGAILSTFNSVLNSSATLFANGIYKVLIRKDATDRQLVRTGRYVSVVIALFAMSVAVLLDTTGSLFNYLQKINATFFGPMLAVLLMSMLTRRVSATAAKAGLVFGPLIFYALVFPLGDTVQGFLKAVFGTPNDIHFLHFLAFVFLITVGIMFAVSYLRPQYPIARKPTTEAPYVDMEPWRWAKPAAVIITVLTVSMYVVLAQ